MFNKKKILFYLAFERVIRLTFAYYNGIINMITL